MESCQLDNMQSCSKWYQIMMQGKYEKHGCLNACDLQGKHSSPVTAFLLYTCKADLLSARKFASWQSFRHACLQSKSIACQSCELATQSLAMSVNMHPSHFLKVKTRQKNAINTTHACTHLGGRGCACAPAFFLYYYHPPHNFFCNIAPFMGRCLHMVIMGCKPQATHYLIPPSPPHSMASDRGYVFVVYLVGME